MLLLALILCAAAAVRIAYLREAMQRPDFEHPGVDAGYHADWARSLASGQWDPSAPAYEPEFNRQPYFRPPGYPYFLGLVFRAAHGSMLAPRVAQVVLGVLNVLLVYALGRRLFSAAAGLAAATLAATYGGLVYFDAELLEPTLLCALLLGGVLLLLALERRRAAAVFAGALLGAAALARPNALVVLPVALGWIVYRASHNHRRAVPEAVALLAGAALVIVPVTIRNYVAGKQFVLISANAGINLYIGNHPAADGTFTAVQPAGAAGFGTSEVYPSILRALEKEKGRAVTYTEASRHFAGLAWKHIAAHPGHTLVLLARKCALFWSDVEIGHNKVLDEERRQSRVLRRLPVRFGAAVALAAMGLGALLLRRRARGAAAKGPADAAAAAFVALVIAAYFASFLPFFVTGQYRMPLVPLLLVFAGHGLAALARLVRARAWRPAAGLLATAAVAYAASAANAAGYRPPREKWFFDEAVAYRLAGRPDEAERRYRQALDVNPTSAEAHYNLAGLLADRGDVQLAIAHYEAAATISPRSAEAHNNLAVALRRAGRDRDAERHWRQAIRLDPSEMQPWYNLGRLYAAQGRTAPAEEAFRRALAVDRGYAPTYRELGDLLRARGEADRAAECYRVYLRAQPDDTTVRLALAALLQRSGRADEAMAEYEEAVRRNPASPLALNELAWRLAVTPGTPPDGRARAVALATEACRLAQRDDAELLDTLATALAAAGRFPEAAATAEDAIAAARAGGYPARTTSNIAARLTLFREDKSYVE